MKYKSTSPKLNLKAKNQRGVILVVAMVFLLLLSVVAVTTMRSGTLELFMAGNEQSRVEAFEKAQGIVSSLENNDGNFSVVGETGFMLCNPGHTEDGGDCNLANLAVDASIAAAVAGAGFVEFDITELYSIDAPPPLTLKLATGQGGDATFWDVRGYYDDRANRQGESEVILGSMQIYPSPESQKDLAPGEGAWFDPALQRLSKN